MNKLEALRAALFQWLCKQALEGQPVVLSVDMTRDLIAVLRAARIGA